MTWNLYCLWIVERLSERGRGGWKIKIKVKIIIPVESVIFLYFLFWCPVEHTGIFISSFSPDWAITGLLGFFFPSGNWIFLAFINCVFIQASTGWGFLPQFPRGHFAHQITCIAYWEVQASAFVMFLIVASGIYHHGWESVSEKMSAQEVFSSVLTHRV